MTDKDIKEQIRIIKKVSKKILLSKKSARKFLIKLGTHNKDGSLTEAYK